MDRQNGSHFSSEAYGLHRSSFGDRLILVLFCVALASFGLCWIVEKADLPLAETLELNKDRSNLEGKTYASFPEPTRSTVADGSFQDGVATFIEDRMPLRDSLLLANASWQRWLISVSASLHGYTVMPTYFGSSYVYDAANDALYETLVTESDDLADRYANAADAYNAFASRHSDQNVYFYRVDRLSTSSNNPTNSLQNNTVNTEYLTERFFDRLAGIDVIDGTLSTQEESLETFFRTDHHWNGIPAYSAYQEMFGVMQPGQSFAKTDGVINYPQPAFYGSCARVALCTTRVPDTIVDYAYDTSGYEVFISGKDASPESLQHAKEYDAGNWGEDPFTNRYAEFWHSDFPTMEIRNPDAKSDESLLVVRDSFSAPLERYFADYYQEVYTIDPRHTDMTVDELMEGKAIDDVLILMGSTNFASDATMASLE